MTVKLRTVEETEKIGEIIGEQALPGQVIVLTGDLGAGKTTLTKGIGKGLGIHTMIKSPTYTLIREYEEGRIPLYHMDVYRLEDAFDLGLDEYLLGDGLCIIEWGEQIVDLLPDSYLQLELRRGQGEDRELTVNIKGTETPELKAIKEKIEACR